jgi:hypothetical protein
MVRNTGLLAQRASNSQLKKSSLYMVNGRSSYINVRELYI